MEWIKSLLKFIMSQNIIINVLLTVVNIILTRKIYHGSYLTYLCPSEKSKIVVEGFYYEFVIENVGHNDAFNVTVKCFTYDIYSKRIFKPIKIKQVKLGNISAQKALSFQLNPYLTQYPIAIEWKTITGYTQKSFWITPIETKRNEGVILPVRKYIPISSLQFKWYRYIDSKIIYRLRWYKFKDLYLNRNKGG